MSKHLGQTAGPGAFHRVPAPRHLRSAVSAGSAAGLRALPRNLPVLRPEAGDPGALLGAALSA